MNASKTADRHTIALIDGPNIDAVLGNNILNRTPFPHERPRWNRVIDALKVWHQVEMPTFVFNGTKFYNPGVFSFFRCLRELGFQCEFPRNGVGDPVDDFIKSEIDAFVANTRPGEKRTIVLFSHDHGYASCLGKALECGIKVTIVGFMEELAPKLLELQQLGAEVMDLEFDWAAFNLPLSRPYQPKWRKHSA